ncbi:peptide-methionine (S)-S-oxide reductase, partial [Bacteroidota bacterium]|nr:peptide-methionine (S)-S-oxide reductase [Bacteroidota bacterium]
MKKYIIILFLINFSTMKSQENEKYLYLGGGCFWCIEAFFENLKGVNNVKSGYAGGSLKNPTYNQVISGKTNHAEVCQVKYNPEE